MRRERSAIQKAALAVGAVFLLVGILGFIPGVTTDYSDMSFAGQNGAKLLGIFEVNVLHNIVHLLFGFAGIAAASSFSSSRTYLIGGGIVYAIVFLYGVLVDMSSSANFIAVNTAD